LIFGYYPQGFLNTVFVDKIVEILTSHDINSVREAVTVGIEFFSKRIQSQIAVFMLKRK
jgi:hypothetical protein